ncbi:MAG: hypothetical protein CL946_04015, partial [Ectothiorhodospiraceae bacterium]|nr:hypothetical protein [Ectothiorhodospiraceae bacterium]
TGLRIFQGLQGAAMLAGSYALFRQINPKSRAPLFYLVMLVSAELWLFLPMLRYYTLAAALAMWAFRYYFAWLDSGGKKHRIPLTLFFIAILYTDYPTAFVIALCGLYTLWKHRDLLVPFLGIAGVAVLAFIPWMGIVLQQVLSPTAPSVATFNDSPVYIVIKLGYSFYAYIVGETVYPFEVLGIAVVAALAILAGYVLFKRKYRAFVPRDWFLIATPVLGVLFTSLITSLVALHTSFVYTPSRTLYALPLVFLALEQITRRVKTQLFTVLLSAVLLIVSGYGLYNYIAGRHFMNPVYAVPWREIVLDLSPSDAGILADEGYCYGYYADEYSHLSPPRLLNHGLGIPVDVDSLQRHDTLVVLLTDRVSTFPTVAGETLDYVEANATATDTSYYTIYDPGYTWLKRKLLKKDGGLKAKVAVTRYLWNSGR